MSIRFTLGFSLQQRYIVRRVKPNLLSHRFCLHLTRQYSTGHKQIILRDYQQRCIDACMESLDNNQRRIGISLPTGGGKTVVFSNLIDKVKPREGHGDRTMILAHRTELIQQAAKTVKNIMPSKVVDIEMADYHSTEDSDVVVASVQTLMRGRLEKFDPKDFKLLIIDEAHHAAANSYQKIIKYFGGTHPDSDVAITGFSATLQRDDEKHLSDVFDEVVFHMTTEEMVKSNFLSEAKFTTVRLANADLGQVGVSKGEFVLSKLSKAVNNDANNEIVLRTYLHIRETYKVKSTLLFGVDIQHVTQMCDLFKSRGVLADFVTSKTKKKIRDETVQKFKDGKLDIVMNCGIFTEGTDIPNIDCVLLVRPTASKNLLIQMIGRGLRLHHSKEYCHIVDFVGINNKNIVSVPTLQGLPSDADINGLTAQEIEERRLEQEEKRRLKQLELEQMEEQARQNEDERLREGLRPDAPIVEIDHSEFQNTNIDLHTFQSFQEFLHQGDVDKESDVHYVATSKFPWRRIEKNTWTLPYPAIDPNANIHLRLQKHEKKIGKKFLKEVTVTSVYKDSNSLEKLKDLEGPIYTLCAYTLKPNPIKSSWNKVWDKKLLLPLSKDVRVPLTYISKIKDKHNISKSAPWRKGPATPRQIETLKSMLKTSSLDESQVDQLHKITKGDASDFMSTLKISKTDYVKTSIKRLLTSRAGYNHELKEDVKKNNLGGTLYPPDDSTNQKTSTTNHP